MDIFFAAVLGYLLGSFPAALVVGRISGGPDVRDYGSGKTGFTNSLRVMGLKRSLPVLFADFGKGLLAATVPLLWTDDPWARAAGGRAAVAGHVWPLFAGFRGGRGVLTGGGALVGLSPLPVLLALPAGAGVLYFTRYMSLTSIVMTSLAALIFLVLAALGLLPWAFAAAALFGGLLVIALHHDNIGRLLNGNERRLGERAEPHSAAD